jgi:hypothetical protein
MRHRSHSRTRTGMRRGGRKPCGDECGDEHFRRRRRRRWRPRASAPELLGLQVPQLDSAHRRNASPEGLSGRGGAGVELSRLPVRPLRPCMPSMRQAQLWRLRRLYRRSLRRASVRLRRRRANVRSKRESLSGFSSLARCWNERGDAVALRPRVPPLLPYPPLEHTQHSSVDSFKPLPLATQTRSPRSVSTARPRAPNR